MAWISSVSPYLYRPPSLRRAEDLKNCEWRRLEELSRKARPGDGGGGFWRQDAGRAITTGEGLPNVDDIRQNLAATTSSFQGILSDKLVSQQVLVGVNYALTEGLSVGVKGRWVHGAAFESDDALVWDPLRSHVPNLRRDESEPVSGQLLTDASTLWDVGLSLTYHF